MLDCLPTGVVALGGVEAGLGGWKLTFDEEETLFRFVEVLADACRHGDEGRGACEGDCGLGG